MKFIVRFFKMTKEEKVKAICRRVYRLLHKREFGELGKKSYIWKPMLVTNRKFIHIGSDCSIYPMARIECITKWGGARVYSEITNRQLLRVWPAITYDVCKQYYYWR